MPFFCRDHASLGLLIVSLIWTLPATGHAQTNIREYIRLDGRIIAIETSTGTIQSANGRDIQGDGRAGASYYDRATGQEYTAK